MLTSAEHLAPLQRVQQGEGGDDQDDSCDGHDDQGHERRLRSAGIGQRHLGTRQHHRVLGHAPAPDDRGDAKRGDGPYASYGRR